MIEYVIQIAMSTVLICGTIAIGVSLLRMHRASNTAQLGDLITSTNKKGRVFLDSRKCFEAGSFCLSTWVMVYITLGKGMTVDFFTAYLLCWTAARALRDREKRLSAPPKSNA